MANIRTREYPLVRAYKNWNDVELAISYILESRLRDSGHEYQIINYPNPVVKLTWNGKYVLLLCPEDQYEKCDWLSDYWNQLARIKCKRFDEGVSPFEWWQAHGYEYNVRDSKRVSDSIYKKCLGCNNFKPMLICHFIRMWNVSRVLDFSSGWGDRGLGCMIYGGVAYTGVDPNPDVHVGYTAMTRDLREWRARVGGRNWIEPNWIMGTAEDCEISGEYDMVFTSPPYFDLEIYGDGGVGQSVCGRDSAESWVHGWLIPVIRKMAGYVVSGGHVVVIINNKKGVDYLSDMITANIGGCVFAGCISYSTVVKGRAKSPQPMWIWNKI